MVIKPHPIPYTPGTPRGRFVPAKRRALDGIVWWCVWDNAEGKWPTYLCHGKYRTKAQCEMAISFGNSKIA